MGDGQDSVDLVDLFGLDGARIHVGRPLGPARNGRLYQRDGLPGASVKLFVPAHLLRAGTDLRAKLLWMVEHPPAGGEDAYAWPRELVVDGDGTLAGFTSTAPVDGVTVRTLLGPNRAARPDWFDDWGVRLEAAASLAAATARLHEHDYVVGDFHDDAVQVAPTGDVTFVDCDSMQVTAGSTVHLSPVGGPEFTPVEMLAQRGRPRTPAADDYALAVHLFALLMGGHRPYTGRWRGTGEAPGRVELARKGLYGLGGHRDFGPPLDLPPADILPPGPRAMFGQSFGPGAGLQHPRPTAAQWHAALTALTASLRGCPRVPTHHFRSGLPYCPWCVLDEQTGRHVIGVPAATPPSALPTVPWVARAPGTSVVSAPPTRPGVPAAAGTVVVGGGAISGGATGTVGNSGATDPPGTSRTSARPAAAQPAAAGPPPRETPSARRRGRSGSRSTAWRWVARAGTALVCLLGAALMVFTALGSVSELPEGDLGAAEDSGGPGAVALTTGGPQTAGGPQTSARASRWPWVGKWRATGDEPRPDFGLRILDDGARGGQEWFTATEESGTCPVRYRGTEATWLDDSDPVYPQDTYGLVLDALLPVGADPAGCALLADPAFYGGSGPEPTSPRAIRIEMVGPAGSDAAHARVTLRPGETVTVTLRRG